MAAAQSLSSLLQRASIDDHEEVLKSCNAALKKSKNDLQAQHVKVVALLKLDRYEDSLRVLEEGGDALKNAASLEYAYALYKCGNSNEAANIAAKSKSGRGAKHVEAQAVGTLFLDFSQSADTNTDMVAGRCAELPRRKFRDCCRPIREPFQRGHGTRQ
jgi:hypothetical protein